MVDESTLVGCSAVEALDLATIFDNVAHVLVMKGSFHHISKFWWTW